MIYKYNELMKTEKYNHATKIKKALTNNLLFKLEDGLYSDKKNNSELEVISKLYDGAIFTGQSAYFYHGLTDIIPKYYYLDTKRKARKIIDERIKQTFSVEEYFEVGKSTINYNNVEMVIYDKERMLIELFRNKNILPFDMYKEIVENYRKNIDKINMLRLEEYLDLFKNNDNLFNSIQLEVL